MEAVKTEMHPMGTETLLTETVSMEMGLTEMASTEVLMDLHTGTGNTVLMQSRPVKNIRG